MVCRVRTQFRFTFILAAEERHTGAVGNQTRYYEYNSDSVDSVGNQTRYYEYNRDSHVNKNDMNSSCFLCVCVCVCVSKSSPPRPIHTHTHTLCPHFPRIHPSSGVLCLEQPGRRCGRGGQGSPRPAEAGGVAGAEG